jgi:phosphoribosyl-dephospho-CoA transferase
MEQDTLTSVGSKASVRLKRLDKGNMPGWKRHTLIDVSDAGRQAILAELAGNGDNSDMLREKFGRVLLPEKSSVRVPGIVRREEVAPRTGHVPVGFCEPVSNGGERLRIAAFVRQEDIVKVTSPYDLISLSIPLRTASTRALAAAGAYAEAHGLILGVWGSAAMEIYTGLSCTHEGSDLDLLVKAATRERLSRFLKEIGLMEEDLGLRIDVELDLPNGYGVQLKELFGKGRTIVGKSIDGVALLSREETMSELPLEMAPFESGVL